MHVWDAPDDHREDAVFSAGDTCSQPRTMVMEPFHAQEGYVLAHPCIDSRPDRLATKVAGVLITVSPETEHLMRCDKEEMVTPSGATGLGTRQRYLVHAGPQPAS